jgi:hypothetical protein
MPAFNIEIVTYAFQRIGVVREGGAPSAAQGETARVILNDYLMNQAADGMRLGWYPQKNLADVAPLRDEDIGPVKLLLARQLATHYGITIKDPVLMADIADAERMLTKRSIRIAESDLGELQRPQSGPWGGPGWL